MRQAHNQKSMAKKKKRRSWGLGKNAGTMEEGDGVSTVVPAQKEGATVKIVAESGFSNNGVIKSTKKALLGHFIEHLAGTC